MTLLGRLSRLLKVIREGGCYFKAKGFSKNRSPILTVKAFQDTFYRRSDAFELRFLHDFCFVL